MAPRSKASDSVSVGEDKAINCVSNTKYPAYRDSIIRSASSWLEGKRIDDAVGNFWRIHDKIYDLSDFIHKHPGGKFWLESTRGTDITEAFESAHLNPAVLKILPKYYIKDATTPRNSPYTFKEDGFYKTLKRKVWPIISKAGSGPTFQMKLMQDCFAASFIVGLLLAAYLKSYLIAIVAGVVLSWTMGMAHTFFHQADNFRMYYFDLSPLASQEWRVTHALSHHLFPNTLLDFEVALPEPFVYYLPDPKKRFIPRLIMAVVYHCVLFIGFYVELLKRVSGILVGQRKANIENILPFLELFIMILIGGDFLTGFKLWLAMTMAASITFFYVHLAGGHHHNDIYHAYDKFREQPDFGLCQLDAVRDRVETTGNLFLASSFFGDHTLHHLFPTIDQSKLPLLYPVFLETCKEFNIPYTFCRVTYLWRGCYKQILSSTPNPNPPGYKDTYEKIMPDYLSKEFEKHRKIQKKE